MSRSVLEVALMIEHDTMGKAYGDGLHNFDGVVTGRSGL